MRDFSISYNKADRPWAEWIAWELEEAGYSTILQAWGFRPGSNFVLDMQRAAADSERTVAVLSPDYLASEFTQPEWVAAFAKDPTGKDRKLLFVRVRDCKLEGLLPQIIYTDLVGFPEDHARKALLDGVKPGRAKPQVRPAFPGTPPAERAVAVKPTFPGGLPAIWNVAHRRNPNFTGLEEELAGLGQALAAGRTATLTQAITGLGGVGKTQLAIEYVYRHLSDYDIVWWVGAEEPVKRAADFAALATPLNLREKGGPKQPEIVAAVRRELARRSRWLLVFDNAGGPEDLADHLPQGTAGHVIVTSRNPAWTSIAKPLSVRVWPRPESVQFLLKRSGDKDEKAADALAAALGDLPLALEHAAAYVEQTGCSPVHYHDLYEKQGKELLRRAKPPTGYVATVATTWEIAFREVEKANPAACDLLNLCAFLAPDNIPLDILREQADELPKRLGDALRDPLALDEALMALRRYSLVEVAQAAPLPCHSEPVEEPLKGAGQHIAAASPVPTCHSEPVEEPPKGIDRHDKGGPGDGAAGSGRCFDKLSMTRVDRVDLEAAGSAEERALWVHRLVQTVAQDRLGKKAWRAFATAAVEAINSAFPGEGQDVRNWPLCSRLSPHAVASAGHAEAEKLVRASAARLLNEAGMYLLGRAEFQESKAAFERALAIGETALGPKHPNVAIAVNDLGEVLRNMGDLQGAKRNFERALKIDEAALGPNHPSVAIRVNNLGSVLQDMGDLEGAKEHYERALAIFRQFLGEEHPKTKLVKRNLATLGKKGC